jgi:hypothetical protein
MNCVRVCPFNKPEGMLHDIVRFIINHFPWLDWLMLKGDTLLRYDKQEKAQFWSE